MESDEKSIELRGELEHTATWVKILENGDLFADHYDYSDDAQNHFGNDVAFLLTVKASEKPRVLHLLSGEDFDNETDSFPDDTLLKLVAERFERFFEFKAWLKEAGVEYEEKFDSWA